MSGRSAVVRKQQMNPNQKSKKSNKSVSSDNQSVTSGSGYIVASPIEEQNGFAQQNGGFSQQGFYDNSITPVVAPVRTHPSFSSNTSAEAPVRRPTVPNIDPRRLQESNIERSRFRSLMDRQSEKIRISLGAKLGKNAPEDCRPVSQMARPTSSTANYDRRPSAYDAYDAPNVPKSPILASARREERNTAQFDNRRATRGGSAQTGDLHVKRFHGNGRNSEPWTQMRQIRVPHENNAVYDFPGKVCTLLILYFARFHTSN
jgi:hypothetical protein